MRFRHVTWVVIAILSIVVGGATRSSTAAAASVSHSSCTRGSAASKRRHVSRAQKGIRRRSPESREPESALPKCDPLRRVFSCRGGACIGRRVSLAEPSATTYGSRQTIKICTLFLFSYIFSVVFNVNNKRALLLVPLPWTYAAINLATGAGMALVSWGIKAAPLPRIDLSDLRAMVPMAFLHATSHLTFVLGLGKGAVSFLQTVKAAEACFTSLISFLLQGQVLPLPVYLSLLPVVIGVGITSLNQPRFSWVALVSALLSNLTNALRNVLIVENIGPAAAAAKRVQTYKSKWASVSGASGHQSSARRLGYLMGGGTGRARGVRAATIEAGGLTSLAPGDTFRLLTLISSLLIIPVAAIMEGGSWPRLFRGALELFSREGDDATAATAAGAGIWARAVRHALLSGISFNLFYDLCFRLLGQLHPVTHAVGNTFKRVFIIAVGAVVFGGDMGGARGLMGTGLAVFGVFIYSVAKAACEPRPQLTKRS